jgi:alkylation response protein AidB-like acyl-CoA dehydrogenase
LFELAVLLEETGWSLVPGPLLPTVLTSALLTGAAGGSADHGLLSGLVDGSTPAGVYLGAGALHGVDQGPDGALVVSGTLQPVLGAGTASELLVPVRNGGRSIWCLVAVPDADGEVTVEALPSLDETRRVGRITFGAVTVPVERQLTTVDADRMRQLAVTLMAAEHVGGARWCLETAAEYAKVRVQFGRPIGQFQAVKHRLADMAVRVEQMTAVAWDAAVAVAVASGDPAGVELAVATAGALAFDGYVRCAQECLQLLGGIGFTWEHDVHLHLKRALADRQLLAGPESFAHQVAEVAGGGARRMLTADLPDDAERYREELAPVVAELAAVEGEERR